MEGPVDLGAIITVWQLNRSKQIVQVTEFLQGESSSDSRAHNLDLHSTAKEWKQDIHLSFYLWAPAPDSVQARPPWGGGMLKENKPFIVT